MRRHDASPTNFLSFYGVGWGARVCRNGHVIVLSQRRPWEIFVSESLVFNSAEPPY
jgi:hypothetical protein